ncbi:centriolin isoform X1 [Passer montanus]|uniref:centriolin isoform X1 n=1 Tax=Passer montanus TaxID=9160 RepID=UPI0019608010|nr:centriolin isoform X1 [Passer montanus]XP_039586676.1 centriolin isoform X1 [Passer montanus]XP_039586677.1 centriolin isoform X1 [Passer montanus]XP_039586678.1 centriolin isoform X1 [Passer montanus]XP_039586680.1 centriolin isoform X1 [Passer montanus]XP_039586681.1 centriolin isoform X1 [Passer montanus]XP_039586682.1 centriolin isoform X1 [Passer montanus]XP_039586683.1 centriolin isoform X1 [Passer montanus]
MKKGSVRKISGRKPQSSASLIPQPMSPVSSGATPPHLGQQTPPAAPKSMEQRPQQWDIPAENVGAAFKLQKGENGVSPGVRYITEPLIKGLSKQQNLACISSLNLSSPKDGDKKFKYIENLEKCSKLEVLNLCNNQIEKIEKLDKLLKLRELNLSGNRISKIEGLEHLQNLQKLNLAGNEIEHIPVWVGKKLRSLRSLNLKQNKVSSLHDIAKLKPLHDLTSLFLAGNPVACLPHYCLYTIFHLRALENLDGQPVTNHDRQEALERFNLEEIEKLEKELENTKKEMESVKLNQTKVLEQLQHQDELNKSLKEKAVQQRQSFQELQRDLGTKNELFCFPLSIGIVLHVLLQLKQKTVELTRACQKQYELEQELAFYKIDVKFEPLNYLPSEEVELDDVPGESPYIGKARYKRNMFIREGYISDQAQQLQVGKVQQQEDDSCRKPQLESHLQSLDKVLQDKREKINSAQRRLEELQSEIGDAEQQVLKVTGELQQLEDALAQKKISQASKEAIEQKLSEKLQILQELRNETLELEKQIEKQKREIGKNQKELEDLQSSLGSVNPEDPRHAHMKAQKASKEQHLDMMNRHCQQLETRLDEMLCRIAKETEEIKDLEQQLTDGQIATNEALKRDLESIIIGLQEYLQSVKHQAKQANEECKKLQKEKESLLGRLAGLEEDKNNLEVVAMDAENMRKEIAMLESSLQEQREINESLQGAQEKVSTHKAELEAQLRERDAEAKQQKEEFERLKQLSQVELSALQDELEKERQLLENAQSKAQLAEEKEQQNYKLHLQFKQLQGDNNFLKQQLKDLQNQLNHAVGNLIHPEDVMACINELRKRLQTGAGEMKCPNSADILGKNLASLQKEFNDILADAQKEKERAQAGQRQLQEEVVSQQEKLQEMQEKYRQVKAENRQNKNKVHQLENEIQCLHEKIKSMEEIQGLADQQLQEADEEKEAILAQLEDLEKRKKIEDARAQVQVLSLDKELKELQRAVITSDKLAANELSITASQLQALQGTVLRIQQERAEELEEAQEFCAEAARASQALAKAEAERELLQQLLKEKEEQLLQEMEKAGEKTVASDTQKFEINKLSEAVEQQKAEIDRLKWFLDNTGTGNKDEIETLQDEIAALRNVLLQQNDQSPSTAEPLKRGGYWYYLPSSQASTPASQSTKDSGVCLGCSGTSPARREDAQHRPCGREDLPSQGCWVYSPVRNRLYEANSGKEIRAKEDGEGNAGSPVPEACPFVPPPGTVIYTALPDGAPAPQGVGVYGPPPAAAPGAPVAPGSIIHGPAPLGSQVVCGPLPPNCTVPLVPLGVLHCNVPQHQDLESEVSRLEDTVCYLKSQKYKEKCSEAAEHKYRKEVERLHGNLEELEQEREELEREVAELRRAAQKLSTRRDFIDGHADSLLAELQLEKSLQQQEDVAEEIECAEKTLLKRRAELREADRLLTEAQVELESTRGKTKEALQKYNRAKHHLSCTEMEAEELEQRAQETATKLVKASQQLRLLQTDTRDLEQFKREQEGILKEINKMVAARDSELQSLNQKIEMLTESLQKLQGDIRLAEGNEGQHLQIIREAENLVQGKKTELETLKDQISAQKQELLFLEQQVTQRTEELHGLQECISQRTGDLKEALRDGETEAHEKLRQIREIKVLLGELSAEKNELDVQMNERSAQLLVLKKDIRNEEENLQGILGQISKHKMELKHVLETLELEKNELEGLKLQHEQKVNELEKTQVAVLEEKLKLENVQRLFQCQQGEVDWQEQLLRKDREENEVLGSQMRALQSSIEALAREKEQLQEDSRTLEKRLSQTKRDLTVAEDSSRTALSNMEKVELEVKNLQQEVELLNKQKKSLNAEIVAVQGDLQGKKEELERLKAELNDSRQQLHLVEQDLENNSRQQEELLREQAALKEEIQGYLRKRKECQERHRKRQNHLQQLQKKIEEKETELTQQEAVLHHLKQNSEREGKKLEECAAKVKDQKILLEKELTDQHKKLEQAIAKVRLAEENLGKLEKEESQCAALEETIRKSKHQLSEKELQLQQKDREIQCLQKELDVSKSELKQLQGQIVSERREAEKQILNLRETQKMQIMELESKLQAKTQDLEERQREMQSAATLLNLEVENEIRMGFESSHSSSPATLEDLEVSFEGKRSLQCECDNSETAPFTAADRQLLSLEEKFNISRFFLLDEQWRGEARREKLQQHEDRLKAQLRRCLAKQAEVLLRGKRQTAGSLHSLQRQLQVLDELVSSTASDSFFLPSSPSLGSLHSVTKAQVPSSPGSALGSPVLRSSSQGVSR